MSVVLRHPATTIIAGPSGSGKTTLVEKLLKYRNVMFSPMPSRVIFCYSIYQDVYNKIKGVEWLNNVPSLDEFKKKYKKNVPTLLIVDDLMQKFDHILIEYFTKGSHHFNVSVIYIVQNLYNKTPQHRTMSLNTHYLFLCKNPRDATPIYHLSHSIYPGNSKFLLNAYKDATAKPFGYLFIDLRQETGDNLRIMTDIFPPDITYVYLMPDPKI